MQIARERLKTEVLSPHPKQQYATSWQSYLPENEPYKKRWQLAVIWKNRARLTCRSSPLAVVNPAFFHSVKAISPAKMLVAMVSFSILAFGDMQPGISCL